MEDLEAQGVVVLRAACTPAACAAGLADVMAGLDQMLLLPLTMAERMREGSAARHFVPVSTALVPAAQAPEHRRDYKLPLSPCIAALLRAALSGEAGAIFHRGLGDDAALCELTAITSEVGACAQDVHSDNIWSASAPRLLTMFVALHDQQDERMGPTRFWPHTHAPRCFPGDIWLPPTAARAEERASVCFDLKAGDAVVFDALAWHCGGANTSECRRTLLSSSFVESGTDPPGAAGRDALRLASLVGAPGGALA